MTRTSNFIVLIAALGFVATSACSRSGGGGNNGIHNGPPPQATPVQTQPSELDRGTSKSSDQNKSELDSGSGKSAQDDKTAPQTPTAPGQTAPDQTAPAQGSGPQETTAPEQSGPTEVTYDPSGLTPKQIFHRSGEEGPAVIGGQSDLTSAEGGDPLFYSGSGQDGLRAQLQTWVDTNTRADRVKRDKEFAAKVHDARFDGDEGSVRFSVMIGETRYSYTGVLDSHHLLHLGDLRHGDDVSIEAACMDLDAGCHTVYAKVQEAKGGLVKTAHVLVRQTGAAMHTHADGFGLANNREFDSFLTTLVRTDHHSLEPNAVNRLTLRTSETINGQSNFEVDMGILNRWNQQESLNFAGPLVKPSDDIEMNAQAQLLASSSPVMNTINNVQLIDNDGRGTITLGLTVRAATVGAKEDTIYLTVARIHKPVRQLIVK